MSTIVAASPVEPSDYPLPRTDAFASFRARTRGAVEACGSNLEALAAIPRITAAGLTQLLERVEQRRLHRAQPPRLASETPQAPSAVGEQELERLRRARDEADDRAGTMHGFLAALSVAFDGHYPLVLSPDDVWLCIAQGFAHHITQNAEALRGRFVQHLGKITLKVRRDDFVKGSPHNRWPDVFEEFSRQIARQAGTAHDLVVADFSTTGVVERAASQIVLMDAMQCYFNYRFATVCGIPRIVLHGTTDDWRRMRERVDTFRAFGLDQWARTMLPVLDEIVATAAGKPNARFWRCIFKKDDGSGGPWVTGWCTVLFPYLEADDGTLVLRAGFDWQAEFDAEWGLGPTLGSFPSGLSVAPFVWDYHLTKYPMKFIAGFAGFGQNADMSVQPAIGWAVRDAGSP